MYLAVKSQSSCARAWIAAVTALLEKKHEAYNVVIDVDDPATHGQRDHLAISMVDRFLKHNEQNPVVTVANTIFPQALYEKHGWPQMRSEYLTVYDSLTRSKQWGRYFERMVRHDASGNEATNPLGQLMEKIREQTSASRTYRSVYELAIYDPARDGRMLRGGQCLSLLSFKLHRSRGLMLTAIYRNHTYVTRLLGNLIGLGRLQAFIAKETGLQVGPLTCVSTHAQLDTGPGWGIRGIHGLVSSVAALFACDEGIEMADIADQGLGSKAGSEGLR